MAEKPNAIQPHRPESPGSLLRVLGVGFGLAVTIGGTIGMGILRTPGEVAKQLPTPTLFIGVWILGGVYALLGAISVAELGAMMPEAGGEYVFLREAYGDLPAFLFGWTSVMLIASGGLAAVSTALATIAASSAFSFRSSIFPRMIRETSSRSSTSRVKCLSCRSATSRA